MSDIQSVTIKSEGNLTGGIGAGSFIINDYLLTISEAEDGYTLSIKKGSQTQTAHIKNAVSISSITKVAESDDDGGLNTIRITLSDGTYQDFNYYNGSKGDKGDPGLSEEERQEMLDAEADRVAAEAQRVSNEQTRVSSEGNRALNETLRSNAEGERVQQEKNRVSAEKTRVSAESARNAAENNRTYYENQREIQEAKREEDWEDLKDNVNAGIDQITFLRNNVEDLAGDVNIANREVVEAIAKANNVITKAEKLVSVLDDIPDDFTSIVDEIGDLESGKADKTDTVLLTTLSRGRKEDSTVGEYSFAFGYGVTASGVGSHAEGAGTTASGYLSHAEGGGTGASGGYSHSEGSGTTASGDNSHAEGSGTRASGNYSHAEGGGTNASGAQSHAEGASTVASGDNAHAEGANTEALGRNSHSEGFGTIATRANQHVFGTYNVYDTTNDAEYASQQGQYIEIVGNGHNSNNPSNARTLDWNGNEKLAGDLTIFSGTQNEISVSEFIGNMMTSSIKQAILNCFMHVSWSDSQGEAYYNSLADILFPSVD